MSHLPPPESDSDRLDQILFHLRRMDRRDRWRTVGGFFRSIITIIPVLLVIASAWYFYRYSDQILEKISAQAAQQAAKFAQPRDGDQLMQQMQKYLQR